jgi:hypothetical protein
MKSMDQLKVVAVEEHGTGAVVDYRSGREPDGAAALLFVDGNRQWAISRFGVLSEPSVGTSDAGSRAGYDRAVADYITAVEERDCKAFEKVAYTDGRSGKAVCKGDFVDTKDLAKRLAADRDAKPTYQGGNRTYGFYVLKMAKPKPVRATISVVRGTSETGDPRYVVLDYSAPVTFDVAQGR